MICLFQVCRRTMAWKCRSTRGWAGGRGGRDDPISLPRAGGGLSLGDFCVGASEGGLVCFRSSLLPEHIIVVTTRPPSTLALRCSFRETTPTACELHVSDPRGSLERRLSSWARRRARFSAIARDPAPEAPSLRRACPALALALGALQSLAPVCCVHPLAEQEAPSCAAD